MNRVHMDSKGRRRKIFGIPVAWMWIVPSLLAGILIGLLLVIAMQPASSGDIAQTPLPENTAMEVAGPSPSYTADVSAQPDASTAADTAAPMQTETAPRTSAPRTPAPTPVPQDTAEQEPVNTPTPTASAPSPTATIAIVKPNEDEPLKGLVIGVDAGHQLHSNSGQEPVSPGSSTTKKKVSSGTQGRFSGVPEYQVNLDVALLLQAHLKAAGAKVIMIRTTNDVDISNVERAQIFNDYNVDLGIRLHCNGSNDASVHGAFMLVPTKERTDFYDENVLAATLVLKYYGAETGISIKKGLTYRSDQTGFNWCERPVINIEMGHMTNEEEDYKLTDADFQKKMALGIYNGIVAYFAGEQP